MQPQGGGGFGYDPIFFYPPLGRTLAELDERREGVGEPPRPGVPAVARSPRNAARVAAGDEARRRRGHGAAAAGRGAPRRLARCRLPLQDTERGAEGMPGRQGRRQRPEREAAPRASRRRPAAHHAGPRAAASMVVVKDAGGAARAESGGATALRGRDAPADAEELAVRELERHFWKARRAATPRAPDRRERRGCGGRRSARTRRGAWGWELGAGGWGLGAGERGYDDAYRNLLALSLLLVAFARVRPDAGVSRWLEPGRARSTSGR